MADDMLIIEELERTVPALTQWRSAGERGVNWSVIEGELGASLPPDYRALADHYPTLLIDDFMVVTLPTPKRELDFVSGVRETSEILQDLLEVDESHGYAPFPEENGLLGWGSSLSGDQFYWQVGSTDDPGAWRVVVSGRNDDWWTFEGGVVEFLVAALGRNIDLPGLPSSFPTSPPEVKGIEHR
ncbi:SMI1/KNR4 family protein [Actinomycetota bacterium Odt1-20B]